MKTNIKSFCLCLSTAACDKPIARVASAPGKSKELAAAAAIVLCNWSAMKQ